MLAEVFSCQKQQIWPFENVRGYDFPIAILKSHVPVTKILVHSLIDAENLRRTTLQQTDIYQNLWLGAADSNKQIQTWFDATLVWKLMNVT